jgi:hypothetical protein
MRVALVARFVASPSRKRQDQDESVANPPPEQAKRYSLGRFGTTQNASARTVKAEIAGSKPVGRAS